MGDSPTTPKEELYCDNPECVKRVISEGPIAYDPRHREIYHPTSCPQLAIHYRSRSGTSGFVRLEQIGMGEALELLRMGKLVQSEKREKKGEG